MRTTSPHHIILLDLITLKYSAKNTGCEAHHYAILFMIHLLPFTCIQMKWQPKDL